MSDERGGFCGIGAAKSSEEVPQRFPQRVEDAGPPKARVAANYAERLEALAPLPVESRAAVTLLPTPSSERLWRDYSMKRWLVLSIAMLALPVMAQQQKSAPAPAPAPKQVAIVNGEVITADRLDHMWNNMGVALRDQYEKAGGKPAFLENYLRKRLVIQEAIKSGFDKHPDVVVDMDA